MEIKPHKFEGVFSDGDTLFTKNLVPGTASYSERLVKSGSAEYRVWDPYRSKLAAYILKGGTTMPIRADSRVLYLGAASGTTASHVSDIAADGRIYCVELSARVARDLISVCESRKNMVPILADANQPSRYSIIVGGVDVVYQDVAQKNQAEIFIKNTERFLKDDGIGVLMLKARSIDVTQKVETLVASTVKKLRQKNLTILDTSEVEPYQKDHCAIVVKK